MTAVSADIHASVLPNGVALPPSGRVCRGLQRLVDLAGLRVRLHVLQVELQRRRREGSDQQHRAHELRRHLRYSKPEGVLAESATLTSVWQAVELADFALLSSSRSL